MRTVDRFGLPVYPSDDDTHRSPYTQFQTPRYWMCLLVTWIVLSSVISPTTMMGIRDTQYISSEVARVLCTTKSIEIETGNIVASLHYSNTESLPINLYATSITRTIQCMGGNEASHTFQYKDDYLNISTVDVDKVVKLLKLTYPIGKSFNAWYYEGYCQKMMNLVDRNCLSSRAIERSEYIDDIVETVMYFMDLLFVATLVVSGAMFHITCKSTR